MSQDPLIQAVIYSNPDHYPPIINSARLLLQNGFRMHIFARVYDGVIPNAPVTHPDGITVERIAPRTSSGLKEYFQFIVRILRTADRSASVIIGHDMHGFLVAKLLAWRLRRPLVYHCHDFVERKARLSLGGRIVRAFESAFARTADMIIVPDAERGAIMAEGLRLKNPPLIVANAPFDRDCQDAGVMAQALSAQGKKFEKVVLRQGRVGEGHAIETTLQSIPLWDSKEWGFAVIGPGEASYFEGLREMAKSLGVESQFALLPPVSYDELVHYTVGADVGHTPYYSSDVNASFNTTASNKITESMAAGLPLLVSDRPALRALVEKYKCGIPVNETSPESIADGVNRLLGEPNLATQMGESGRRAFKDVFCYEKQFAPALEIIRRLCLK